MPYLIRIVEWLEFYSRSHQPNRHQSGVSHLYKCAQAADLQFCSPRLNKLTRGTEKVSCKQSGLSLQHLVSQTFVHFITVPSTNTLAGERRGYERCETLGTAGLRRGIPNYCIQDTKWHSLQYFRFYRL